MRRRWTIAFFAAASLIGLQAPAASAGPAPKTCIAERGLVEARVLANRCMMVSGATHPPCNPLNPCSVMQEHIDYMCRTMGVSAPECDHATPFTRKHLNWYKSARPIHD